MKRHNKVRGGAQSEVANKLDKLHMRHCGYYTDRFSLSFEKVLNLNANHVCKEVYAPESIMSHNIHLGQRKLLLSEIQLLTRYYTKYPNLDPVLLYIGSATGSHLTILSALFPKVKFILYDYAKFDPRLKQKPKVFEIHEGDDGFFTTEKCRALIPRLKKIPLIFVSDIRQDGGTNWRDFEAGVERDLELQKIWVQLLNPLMSLLKFRIPFHKGSGYKMPYLKGDIYYGIWAPPLSAETRLLVEQANNYNVAEYEFDTYEGAMFFHNKYTRQYCFNNEYLEYTSMKDNPYCPCYDCIAELNVLDEYATLKKKKLKDIITLFGKHARFNKLFDSYKGLPKKKVTNIELTLVNNCGNDILKKSL